MALISAAPSGRLFVYSPKIGDLLNNLVLFFDFLICLFIGHIYMAYPIFIKEVVD
jgi:hypothetical protein